MPESVTPKKIAATKTYQRTYDKFRGVDFSTDPTQVADFRSPYAENLISDLAGFPEKRPGWRTLLTVVNERINGIYYCVFKSGATARIIHAKDKLYKWNDDNTVTLMFSGMNNQRSAAFAHGGKLYMLDGLKYRVITENNGAYTVQNVEDTAAFIPTTTIGADPTGGGTHLEAVNMLSNGRINSFRSNGNDKTYYLDTQNITAVTKVLVGGTLKTPATDYTVDLAAGTVTLAEAPADSKGVDNVVIHFTATVEGYADRVNKCTLFAYYGYNNDNRVFISGNPEYKNWDWQSGLDDPTYFPDTGYTRIGADTSSIMGYIKQYDSLMVVKDDNQQDAEVFLRTAEMQTDGTVIFPIKQGIKGVGAVSKYAFDTLRDDPLFLAREGVFGISSTSVQLERNIQDRSYFVNTELTKENGLDEAVSVVWNGYYILCINNKCFVADSRHRSAKTDGGASYSESGSYVQYGYEWYYWTNIPARVFFEQDGSLFFGTADGKICRFNTDRGKMNKYNDDGQPITAIWSTQMDNYGTITRRKSLTKKGCGVMIKPYTRSSVKILVATDRIHDTQIRSKAMDILDFSDIDFERITFNTLDTPQVIAFNKKVKKFIVIQIIFKNDTLDEGFGIYGVQVQYVVGGYVK